MIPPGVNAVWWKIYWAQNQNQVSLLVLAWTRWDWANEWTSVSPQCNTHLSLWLPKREEFMWWYLWWNLPPELASVTSHFSPIPQSLVSFSSWAPFFSVPPYGSILLVLPWGKVWKCHSSSQGLRRPLKRLACLQELGPAAVSTVLTHQCSWLSNLTTAILAFSLLHPVHNFKHSLGFLQPLVCLRY